VHTGVDKDVIDGVCFAETMSETSNPFWGVYLCEQLGLEPSWMQVNGLGGASTIGGVARAAAAIRDGLCETVLVLSADAQSSWPPTEQGAQRFEFQYPVGLNGPPGVSGSSPSGIGTSTTCATRHSRSWPSPSGGTP